MSALSRFGSSVLRPGLVHHQRHMASATTVTDPIQKLFLDKVSEFKTSNKGLDEAHQRMVTDEMARLKRVYKVEDEHKLANIDCKFPPEANVSLRDLDETAQKRKMIASGEITKKLMETNQSQVSPIISSVPDQTIPDLHLPPSNKPDLGYILEHQGVPRPMGVAGEIPDYLHSGELMTPKTMMHDMRVNFGPNMPTIHDDKDPQRDTENFPRYKIDLYSPPTRYHIIPESWFRFFYPKTGLTGPYAFAGGLTTLFLSKEWLPIEHEILTGFTTTIIITYAVIKFGPKVRALLEKGVNTELDDWDKWQKGNIEYLQHCQRHYSEQIKKTQAFDDLYDIRMNDVELQLEHERRSRIKQIYEDTKRRLDYLVSVAESKRQIAQKNMVNWVISNAHKSFGPKQETDVLDSCIANLKTLARQKPNAV